MRRPGGSVSRYAGLILILLLLRSGWAHAAAGAGLGQIKGKITDALARPLQQVKAELQASDGRTVGRIYSDASGGFVFNKVSPGVYAIVAHKAGFKPSTSIITVPAGRLPAPVILSMASEEALSLQVVTSRLNLARNQLSPETGSSVYRFSEKAIQELPQGANTPMSAVLLQAPGVAQDSFGGLHIRGEHGDIQYRINGIELPEGISSGFSQTFSPRFAQSVSLLEGALPAQYGYHTAGVVQIQTKSGESLRGGDIEMYGGQRDTLQPNFELSGSKGNLSYYLTGYYLQNSRGLEPPTPGPEAIHDFTTQGNMFGYLSYLLSPNTKLSLISGVNVSKFQIPANPGRLPAFSLAGVSDFPSADVRESQLEQNYYSVLALQGLLSDKIDYQVAGFTRYSTLSFYPDQEGDLIYNGIASRIFRGDWTNGLQGDFTYRVFDTHTFRGGLYFTGERAEIDNHARVFPGGPSGQTSDQPETIVDDGALIGWLYGIYLQDEWHPIPKLTINYGVRLDLYDGLTRSAQASPRVGLVYQLFETTELHAAYARYFTPPPLEAVSGEDLQRFNGTTNQPAVTLNSTISPERAHYFDVGVTQKLPHGLIAGLDGYYKKSRDLIDEGQFGPTLIFTPFNYDKARQYGAEVTGSFNHENLSAYVNFAYSVAQGIKIKSDQLLFGPDELAYISRHYVFLDHDQTFTASTGFAYDLDGFLLSVDGIYGSGLRRGFANTGNQPFYVQVDMAIAKRAIVPGIGGVEARLAVINIGDWIYQLRSGSGIGVFAPQFGPRRTVYCGLKWELPWFRSPAAQSVY